MKEQKKTKGLKESKKPKPKAKNTKKSQTKKVKNEQKKGQKTDTYKKAYSRVYRQELAAGATVEQVGFSAKQFWVVNVMPS